MWTHLSRQAVGGVGLRGPGETQLEVDRRRAQERITKLKSELVEVHEHRERYRQKRRREGVPVVALVGYTNAGKSTLLNALSDADVRVENVLFATLDPTTRLVALPDGQHTLLTDTVGFIQRLPTQLVAAFRATLEEIQEADVLVHVLDLTHPNAEEQSKTVDQLLKDLDAGEKPRVVALNKIDRLFPQLAGSTGATQASLDNASAADNDSISAQIRADMNLTADYVPISARLGWGMDELLKAIQEKLTGEYKPLRVLIPYGDSEMVSLLHERGVIESQEHVEAGTLISGRVPGRFSHLFDRYKA
jgi:GTP-binding protein HflX